ncbi:DUF3592 domain-containing protein [Aquipseudomonas alcaligenes]|nr:DUF3592 domain-containing protein [Pseudomonas alcaligenes]
MRMAWLWIFPLIGVALLAGAVAVQVHRVGDQVNMLATTGTVTDIAGGCPTIEFSTGNGEPVSFRGGVCSNPPSFAIGESVAVLYEAANPSHAQLDSFMENWFVSLILGGIGALFTLLGLVFVLPPLFAKRRAAELRVSGLPVFADLVSVRLNESLSINGVHPWKIDAQWLNPATNKLHLFSSDNLWFDPSPYITEKQVRVLIDPNKPKRYSMDVSFLPELAD